MTKEYSVLMSVYAKEKPENLETSILSMIEQTIPPSEFVIVCDGPLTQELNEVLFKFSSNKIFNIIQLDRNYGLSHALKIGLEHCKFEIVLRMDSDDISFKDRAEKEIEIINKGYDIVGSYISEFVDDPKNIVGYRKVPVEERDIVRFSKKRNPFNHPSVAFRKSKILSSGNYSEKTKYMQDYFLWIRCLQNSAKCSNIPETLVNMRSGKSMRSRRSGKEYRYSYKAIFKYMLKTKYIGLARYYVNIISYTLFSLMSGNFKEKVTYRFLRKKEM